MSMFVKDLKIIFYHQGFLQVMKDIFRVIFKM